MMLRIHKSALLHKLEFILKHREIAAAVTTSKMQKNAKMQLFEMCEYGTYGTVLVIKESKLV